MMKEVEACFKSGRKLEALKIEVEKMKKSGLIRGPGDPFPVKLPASLAENEMGGLTVQFVSVTPAMAQTWLRNNIKNRKLRQTTVDAYARDMKAGNWLRTHQGIAFAENGELLDGQHRLSAIVQSGVAIEILVTRGLASAEKGKKLVAQDVMDCGSVRKVGDQLALQHNVKNASAAAACSTIIAMLCREPGYEIKRITFAQALGILEIYGDHIQTVLDNQTRIVGLRSSQVSGAVAFARAVDPVIADEFLRRFTSGAGLDEGSPILHMRNCLLNQITRLKMSRGSSTSRVLLADRPLQHLWLFKEGRSIQSLSDGKDGPQFFRAKQQENIQKVRQLFR
jgi:hypothetical protein